MRINEIAVSPALIAAGRTSRALLLALMTVTALTGCGDNPDDLVASARQEISKKEYRSAILQLKTALQKDANHKDARYELGVALRESGDLPASEKELRRALDLGFDKNAANRELARTLYKQGRLDDFIKEFGALQLANTEENAELRALTGNALFARGKVDEAVKAYEESLRLVPGNNTARVGQARVAAYRSDVAGAEAIVTEVLGKAPKDQEALTVRAALYLVKGDRDNAIATHRKLVEYYPQAIGEHFTLASMLLESDKLDEAKAAVAEMVKVAPNDPRTLQVQAMLAYQGKDYTNAQQLAVKALSRAPNFTPAQLVAGAASVQLKNYQQAIQYLTEVVKVQKRNIFAHQLLVAAYLGAEEAPRADRALKEALQLFPNNSKLLLLAGELAARNRKMGDAAKFFELSAESGDATGLAQMRRGQVLMAEGKENEAVRVLEESAGAAGAQAQSDYLLVIHHLRRGEVDKALKWIDSIEKKSPGTVMGPTLRGVAFLTKQDNAGARKQFELALQRNGAVALPLSYLARLDIQEKKPEDAKRRYEEAIAKNPTSEQLVIDQVRLLRAVDNKIDVVSAPLIKFIKANPAAERSRLALVEVLLASGDSKQAVTVAREAAVALPAKPGVKMALGQALRAAGENTQAVTTFGEVLSAEPRNLQALVAAAQASAASGDNAKSLEYFGRAVDVAPENPALRRMMIASLVQARQTERALTMAREFRQKNPKQAAGYEMEAGVLVSMDKWTEAAEVLRSGHREAPSAQMAIRLHAALSQAGQKDQAAQVASQWIGSNGKDVVMRAYLGERASAAGDHPSAVRYYKEAIAVSGNNPLLLNNLAWSAGQVNDPKAISYAEEALKLAPNAPAIMDTLGWMLVQRGDTARGVDLLEKASKSAPQAFAIRFNYAQALVKAGRKDDARKEMDFLKSQGERFKQQAELEALYKQL